MMARLLLAMTIIPAIELYLLLQLGKWMGVGETVFLIVLTGALGASFAKREGLAVLRQLGEDARSGIPPADRLVEGVLVLVGGILLITPGVLTDLTGLLLLTGPFRRWLAPRVKGWVARRFIGLPGGVFVGAPRHGPGQDTVASPPPAPGPRPPGGFDHPVA